MKMQGSYLPKVVDLELDRMTLPAIILERAKAIGETGRSS